jgi:hypothetical protein
MSGQPSVHRADKPKQCVLSLGALFSETIRDSAIEQREHDEPYRL